MKYVKALTCAAGQENRGLCRELEFFDKFPGQKGLSNRSGLDPEVGLGRRRMQGALIESDPEPLAEAEAGENKKPEPLVEAQGQASG